MDETTALAEFTVSTSFSDLPTEVVRHAEQAIRDYVGVALYGSHHPVGERIFEYIQRSAPGNDASLVGHGTASAPGAALANGTFGHVIDYDDTFESIVIHPTSPVFAAALAASELAEANGRDLLTGYAVGVEAAFRVGHATYPSHYDNGWHCTGTVGSFGASAAAASLLGLSTETTCHAFGIVASLSSSLKKNFGSMTKPLHAGHAAEMGVRSALLARSGFTADPDVLDGTLGYGTVMTPGGDYDPSAVTEGLGETWAVSDIGFKPYPSGVITHAAMDALRALLAREGLSPEDVATITVTLDDAATEMLIHANPENALQAKFSIEFCLAAILREGDAGIHEFIDEYVTAPETQAQLEKVERAFEANLFGGTFAGYGARVVVETTDGEEHIEEKRHAPGSPTNPLSDDRLEAKFAECTKTVLDSDEATTLAATIDHLDDEESIEPLTALLRTN